MTTTPDQEQAYAEIEAEASGLVQSAKKPLPVHAKPVLAALLQHHARLPVIERCPYCAGLLRVDAPSESAWLVVCPCGKSKDTFRGL